MYQIKGVSIRINNSGHVSLIGLKLKEYVCVWGVDHAPWSVVLGCESVLSHCPCVYTDTVTFVGRWVG